MKPLGEQGEGQWAEQQEEQCAEEEQNSEECRGDAEAMQEAAEDAHVFHQPQKLPVFRKIVKGSSSIAGKSKVAEGKGNKGGEDESTSSDSDYEVEVEDEDNSSADDEEAIEFRKYARELKNKVRNKMLGEEDEKGIDVPEDFLVPEDCKLDDGDGDVTPYFDSADDLSYDEASDGDDMLKRKKTDHKVYDSTSEIPLFSVGMAFHDSRHANNTSGNKEHANFTRAARRRRAKQARTEQDPGPSTQQSSAPGPSTQQAPRASKPPNRKKRAPASQNSPSTAPFYERAKNTRRAQTQSSQPPSATSSYQPAHGSTSQPMPNQSRFQWLHGNN